MTREPAQAGIVLETLEIDDPEKRTRTEHTVPYEHYGFFCITYRCGMDEFEKANAAIIHAREYSKAQ